MLAEEEVLKLPKNTEDARKKAETKIKVPRPLALEHSHVHACHAKHSPDDL
jgi:hypothetical protein